MATRTDITVAASALDTSGNGGRKIIKLSNGYYVAYAKQTGTTAIKAYVSTDNCATWSIWETTNITGLVDIAIQPLKINNRTVCLYSTGTAIKIQVLDSGGNTVSALAVTLDTITAGGNVSLIVNDAGTEIHAVWACRNSTYPNSNNIRYVKGRIDSDVSITWGLVEQLTTYNISGYNASNPTIALKADGKPAIIYDEAQGTGNVLIYCQYFTSSWNRVLVYNALSSSYTQYSPSAIFVPKSINGLPNGRIWVAWHGLDSTDSSVNNIRLSYSDDGGATWSAMTKLTSGNTLSSSLASITANKANEIFVVYEGYISGSAVEVRQVKYNGAWGSPTTITNVATTTTRCPATFFDLNQNFSSPLFLYKGTSKVGFYGTWTVISISIAEGPLGGTKTDRNNIVDYAITTDGSMSTITEKINGTVVGTKTLTNGGTTTVALSQALWDTIKFGKYADAIGGLNTLTVEMGVEKWTFTFDKRNLSNDTAANVLKAIQDAQTAFLPSVKTKLCSAIRDKGASISDTDSFDTITNAIKTFYKKATGQATSGTSLVTYNRAEGTNTETHYNLIVSGLTFKPSIIIITSKDTSNDFLWNTYYRASGFNKSGGVDSDATIVVTNYYGGSASGTTAYSQTLMLGSVGSVSETGFTLPVGNSASANGKLYEWIALE